MFMVVVLVKGLLREAEFGGVVSRNSPGGIEGLDASKACADRSCVVVLIAKQLTEGLNSSWFFGRK